MVAEVANRQENAHFVNRILPVIKHGQLTDCCKGRNNFSPFLNWEVGVFPPSGGNKRLSSSTKSNNWLHNEKY
jgi:hypothetical protein